MAGMPGRLDPIAQHLGALLVLFEMAGRGVEDEQQFGTGSMRQFGRTGSSQMSAQILMPQRTPPSVTTQASVPGSK
jgi:hypothetical protein